MTDIEQALKTITDMGAAAIREEIAALRKRQGVLSVALKLAEAAEKPRERAPSAKRTRRKKTEPVAEPANAEE